MTNELSVSGIIDTASAFYRSAALFAAIDAGVFNAVAELGSAATAAAVAGRCDASERGVRLLLDALVAIGLMRKSCENIYSNTPAGSQTLVSGAAQGLGKAIRYNRDVYPAWGRLLKLVKTGAPVERPEIHLGDDAERTRAFAASMFGRAMGIGRAVTPMLKFPGDVTRVLDLAGGPAAYAILMAKTYPSIAKVTSVDLPAISREAARFVKEAGMEERVECRPGDYHCDSWEHGAYDAVTLFGCLHQESPEDIVAILRKAHDALRPGGRVAVLDMMTDPTRTEPAFSALFALNMALTMPNGWVFSDSELHGWLVEAGFRDPRTEAAPPPMPHWLVSAVRD